MQQKMRVFMQNTNYRFTLLNTLKAKLGDAVTITDETDNYGEDYYSVDISLGKGWAGSYEGGYWGDCAITNDELELHFLYGYVYGDDEEAFGEGMVQLNYKGGTDNNGLAYTGALDRMIEEKVEKLTDGVLTCSGSEQGMQGHYGDDESYLSVDMGELVDA
tara:strand:+ start:687 stop:1169 length:483 start_codon:yes stop_codon:yes gene_type:complete